MSVISKFFEKFVYKYVLNFIRNLLSEQQSGITLKDSIVNQLLYFSDVFTRSLDQENDIRVVFFDIGKSFDRVWHRGLVYKLQKWVSQVTCYHGSVVIWKVESKGLF